MSGEPGRALDDNGRCCGRKPLVYKRPFLHHFCPRCDRQYDDRGVQMPNWAWRQGVGNTFHAKYPANAAILRRAPAGEVPS